MNEPRTAQPQRRSQSAATSVSCESPRLAEFLSESRFSVHREIMMRHQMLHDIHLTFARFGKTIYSYEPEVDSGGFDIVIDDMLHSARFQLKTKLAGSSTSSWEIRGHLLRPDHDHLNHLPFSPDSYGIGYMGGVILSEARIEQGKIEYKHFYTDCLVILAQHFGIAPPSKKAERESVAKCFRELTKITTRPGKITLTKSCFWKFSSLRPIMALAGFQVGYCGHVRHVLLNAVSCLSSRPQRDRLFESKEQAIAAAESALDEIRSNF